VLKLCERGAIEFAVLQAKITVISATVIPSIQAVAVQ
jgi:hypothetical protein